MKMSHIADKVAADIYHRPIAEAVRMAQEAGRKYITVASRILAKEAS